MKTEILFCKSCNEYTLNKKCKNCGNDAITTKPAKFNLEDKYLKYRILAKKNDI